MEDAVAGEAARSLGPVVAFGVMEADPATQQTPQAARHVSAQAPAATAVEVPTRLCGETRRRAGPSRIGEAREDEARRLVAAEEAAKVQTSTPARFLRSTVPRPIRTSTRMHPARTVMTPHSTVLVTAWTRVPAGMPLGVLEAVVGEILAEEGILNAVCLEDAAYTTAEVAVFTEIEDAVGTRAEVVAGRPGAVARKDALDGRTLPHPTRRTPGVDFHTRGVLRLPR